MCKILSGIYKADVANAIVPDECAELVMSPAGHSVSKRPFSNRPNMPKITICEQVNYDKFMLDGYPK